MHLKRWHGAIAAVVFAVSARAETNYFLNPSFETGNFNSWSTFGQGWYIGTGGDAQHGTYGAVNQINASDNDDWRGVYQEFAVQPSEMYSASVWIRGVAVESTRSWLEIQWRDASGNTIAQRQSAQLTTSAPYAEFRLEALAPPANAVTASVRGIVQRVSPPSGDPDWHLFDRFSFYRHRPQLIQNRSFETGSFASWQQYGQGWYIGSGADAHHGSYGAVNVVNPSDSDEWRVTYQNVPVIPGLLYRGGAYIRGVGIDTTKSYFEIQFLDSGGNILEIHQSPHLTQSLPFGFYSTTNLLAPANAATASVRCVVQRPPGNPPPDSDWHIFDYVMFEEVTPTHPILVNWGFETTNFWGWSTFGPGWTVTTGAAVYANNCGAQLTVSPSDTDAWRGVFQNVAVTAGLTYVAGTYISAASVDSSKSYLEVQWFDIDGNLIAQTQSAHIVASQPFQRVMMTLIAPAGAATASVRGIVHMMSPPPNPDYHYFDEFFFLRPVDLTMSITASTNYAEVGVEILYTLVISNRSPSMSGAFFVSNSFPAGLQLVSTSPGANVGATSVWWELFGLPGGSTWTQWFRLKQPYTGSTQLIQNVILSSVTSVVGDPVSGNNATSVTTTTVGVPVLTLIGFIALLAAVGTAMYRRLVRRRAVCAHTSG